MQPKLLRYVVKQHPYYRVNGQFMGIVVAVNRYTLEIAIVTSWERRQDLQRFEGPGYWVPELRSYENLPRWMGETFRPHWLRPVFDDQSVADAIAETIAELRDTTIVAPFDELTVITEGPTQGVYEGIKRRRHRLEVRRAEIFY
jgi:hypothetical protein